jgi:hypothetical protein
MREFRRYPYLVVVAFCAGYASMAAIEMAAFGMSVELGVRLIAALFFAVLFAITRRRDVVRLSQAEDFCTHVLNRGGLGVRSPLDALDGLSR